MIDLTLRLDYADEAELFDSYLWGRVLDKAITCNRCESFRTSVPFDHDGTTVLQVLNLFHVDDNPPILCFEDDGTGKNYALLHSNELGAWTPAILRREVTRISIAPCDDPPTGEPTLIMYLRKEN